MKLQILLAATLLTHFSFAQDILKYEQNQTLTHDEAVSAYTELADKYPAAKLFEEGLTDVGRPLHLFVISKDGDFDPASLKKKGKLIMLINNGIHPGEPCGIDASVKFAHTVLSEKEYSKFLDKVVIAIIPVYNIGGCLNRSPYWRPQQPGPEELGFRGNARNLDLNRDFVKLDTRNARSFTQIFHKWNPEVFLDTHTTNGSDHKYAITLITTQKDRFSSAVMGDFVKNTFENELFSGMAETDYPLIPYISWMHANPEEGIIEYFTNPNFSSGYTAVFNTISFMTENHVYKPFRDRVLSVYAFELTILKASAEHAETIIKLRAEANAELIEAKDFVLNRRPDTTRHDAFEFTGYRYLESQSPFTGLPRKAYNHDSVFTTQIPYYRYYTPTYTVEVPEMYIIPQAWHEVIEALKLNKVKMYRLTKDIDLEAEFYYIKNNEKAERQYNGHIANVNFDLCSEQMTNTFRKGDYVVPLRQDKKAYLLEILEPKGDASFFRWNFFDPILERREYMIPNGFEKVAPEILEQNPGLKKEWEQKIADDPAFAKNHYQQLWYIYTRSPYDENTYLRYPVARIMKPAELPLAKIAE